MTWSKGQYEDAIRSHCGDLGILQHLPDTAIPLALRRALATFSKDKPRPVAATFSGDGTTRELDLSAAAGWQTGWSRIESVEYPAGNVPRDFIDSHGWTLEEDTDTLVLGDTPAAGTDNIVVRFTSTWPAPDDDPSDDAPALHELFSEAIAELAASIVIRGKAVEFARQQSTSVQGNLYQRDPASLFSAAANLKKSYEETVLGRPQGEGTASAVAMSVVDVDVFPDALLHRRQETIDEEDAFTG